MNENVTFIARLSGSSVLTFLKINALSAVSTIAVLIIEFIVLSKSIDAGHSGHVSAAPFLALMFFARPVGSVLFYLTAIISPFLFFALGNKYILSKGMHKIAKEKGESVVGPLLDKVLAKLRAKQPDVVRSAGEYSLGKIRMIDEMRQDKTTNKWLRKVLIFGLKKVSLEDVAFNREDLSFYDIVREKTLLGLQNATEPSRKSIWTLVAVQWVVMLFVVLNKF